MSRHSSTWFLLLSFLGRCGPSEALVDTPAPTVHGNQKESPRKPFIHHSFRARKSDGHHTFRSRADCSLITAGSLRGSVMNDTLLAATADEHELYLATRNVKHVQRSDDVRSLERRSRALPVGPDRRQPEELGAPAGCDAHHRAVAVAARVARQRDTARRRLLCAGESVKLPRSHAGHDIRPGLQAFTGGPLG